MQSGRAKGFENAIALLFDGAFRPDIGRFRSNFAFRGMSKAAHEPITSLMRMGGPFAELEGPILRNFAKYAERVPYASHRSPWNWITVAQHHGLPTRLLDWTWSPLVALHFATAELSAMGDDGRVLGIDVVEAHKLLPAPIVRALMSASAYVPTIEMLDQIAPGLDKFDDIGGDFVLFFEPPSIDERIVNQYAFFSVMPGAGLSLTNWMAVHRSLCQVLEIPASIKWEIRDKLDSININERVLFPGLDGLAQWLKRHYSPGPPTASTGKPAT